MKLINRITLSMTITLLIACTDKNGEPTGAIPEHQMQSLDKAKNVEQILNQSDLNKRQHIDET